jgi:acyl transferase domain-containing protein
MLGQAEVIARAHARAGATPESIQLLEAHGTATNLGDVIEFGALRNVFGGARLDGTRVALGSVKSNIGHLDTAAGVTSLIKVVEALKQRKIPPTLHARVPSRKLDFGDSPFYLNPDLADWPSDAAPRRAGVSSFGVGGTNVHMVVEEAVVPAEPSPSAAPRVLPLSAKNERSLRRMMQQLAEELERHPELSLDDVAFTLQVGRIAHPYRSHVVADAIAAARSQLAEAARLNITRSADTPRPAVAFLFPGQGTQQRDATWELYETQPHFRSAFDECADIARQYTGNDLRAFLYTKWQSDAAASVDIDQTALAQPLLFATEYALAQWWAAVGVAPAAMLGHSIGEWAAACLAGVFSLPEALSLVLVRGQLLQSLEAGRMLAVGCGEARLRELLTGSGCDLAAVNGARQCVVSGASDAIGALQSRLEAEEISTRALRTSHAFHSAMVEPVLQTFENCVSEVERNRPSIPFISNLTGTWITDEQATSPSYWARQIRGTVRFADGVRELAALPNSVLVEVGPGNTLTTLVNRIDSAFRAVSTLGAGRTAHGEAHVAADAIGRLWSLGVDIDWMSLYEGRRPRRVPLPAYAFEHKRYWIERSGGVTATAATEMASDALDAIGREVDGAGDDGRGDLQSDYVPPSNDFEAKIADIWRTYLGVDKIGVRDSFFDLGGDSLLATRIHAQIRRDLGIALPLAKMFEFTTIRRIYLYTLISQNPDAIEDLSPEELDDCLAMLQP